MYKLDFWDSVGILIIMFLGFGIFNMFYFHVEPTQEQPNRGQTEVLIPSELCGGYHYGWYGKPVNATHMEFSQILIPNRCNV